MVKSVSSTIKGLNSFMFTKVIWISFFALILIAVITFGTIGIEVTPVKVEKEVSLAKLSH